jgi:hypothetical protein
MFLFCFVLKSPLCVSETTFDVTNDYINDLCMSPSEPSLVALCKINGTVEMWKFKIDNNSAPTEMNSLEIDCRCRKYFSCFS